MTSSLSASLGENAIAPALSTPSGTVTMSCGAASSSPAEVPTADVRTATPWRPQLTAVTTVLSRTSQSPGSMRAEDGGDQAVVPAHEPELAIGPGTLVGGRVLEQRPDADAGRIGRVVSLDEPQALRLDLGRDVHPVDEVPEGFVGSVRRGVGEHDVHGREEVGRPLLFGRLPTRLRGPGRTAVRLAQRQGGLARHAQGLLDGAVHELGPELDGPVGRVVGHDPAAQPIARLEHQHAHSRRGEIARRGQPRDPGPDDEDLWRRAHGVSSQSEPALWPSP